MFLSADELSRYTQQLKLTEIGVTGQLQLKQAKVLCVGAGGLGSPLLLYLAAIGVGTLGIVDNDQIELSNLQRQILYQTNHLHQPKVAVAAQQLTALNPHVTINTYPVRLTAENAASICSEYDIIADCTDNFATRYLINDTCRLLNKPLVAAAIQQFAGQCMVFMPMGACLRCLFPITPAQDCMTNCTEGGVLGLLPGWFGILQAMAVAKVILTLQDHATSKLTTYDMLQNTFCEWLVPRETDCRMCAKQTNFAFENPKLVTLTITVQALQHRLQTENILLLDVRSAAEHAEFNIGGNSLPLPDLANQLPQVAQDHSIVCYCQTGVRSQMAAQILLTAGFINVTSLAGGISAFTQIAPSLMR